MPLDFYYMVLSPPCRAVQLVAEALGLTLNPMLLDLHGKKEHLKEDFLKINPQHCVPTLVDEDLVLWESRPIMIYLVEQYGKNDNLYPKDPVIRGKIDQLLYFDMGTLFSSAMDGLFRPVIFGGQKPQQSSVEKVYDALGFLEQFLEGHLFAVGNRITIADYALVITVGFIDDISLNIQKYPKVSNWFNRCTQQIPGYDKINKESSEKLKAMSKGKFRT